MNDEPKYLNFCCILFVVSFLFLSMLLPVSFFNFFIFYTIEIVSKIFKILIKLINHILKNETKITNVFIIY